MSSRWFILIALLLAGLLSGCETIRDSIYAQDRERASGPVDPLTAPISADEYRLGAGDIFSIRIYDWRAGQAPGEEDLRIDRIRLDQSGMISLPFGQFKAAGHTLKELESAVADRLRGRLLRNPRLLINMEEYRPFYVEGQVGRPGAYPYQPGLNVRKAVAIGGGFRERASLQRIFVVRENDQRSTRIKVNLNSPIGPGDTLTVEESFF